jgi:nucleotide-binding universal stress UspA family protein
MLGGSLLLVTFVESSSFASYSEGYVFGPPDENDVKLVEARAQLEYLAASLRTSTRPVDVCARFGTPYFDVATLARDVGADVVAMATHGRGGLSRAILGSVTTSTIQRSHAPLLIVPPTVGEQGADAVQTNEPAARSMMLV